jgi:tetratricopeptide (TPR) repeat protein
MAKVRVGSDDPGLTYLQARAASMTGDHARAAALMATLAEAQPDQPDLARNALSEAIGAGQMDLALELTRRVPQARLTTDAKLLLAAQELRRNRPDRALPWLTTKGESGSLDFLAPLVTAWTAAQRGDLNAALAGLDQIPANGLLAPLRAEERALILLKFKRTADAKPFAERAVAAAGNRENRLRLAFADAFLAAGDRASALEMVEGMGIAAGPSRARVLAGKTSGIAVDTPAEALSEVLTGFAADVARMARSAPPIGLVQVARYANPENSGAVVLLALLLDDQERSDEAVAILKTVPANDPLAGQARDIQVRILTDQKNFNEAYAVAQSAALRSDADISDFSRVGDVYEAMKRHDLAADAYGKAAALATAQNLKTELWPLLLLQANALEEGKRWPEAKQALERALVIAPEQPLLLNFLGYAKLERGEDLDSSEAMIRKASALSPDDASITDSLGWAQFKRGKVADAISTLQRAAEKDPDQAEIQEHLGDALFTSGRRFEARFAWSAALVTAEDDVAARLHGKLASGLTPANAAP